MSPWPMPASPVSARNSSPLRTKPSEIIMAREARRIFDGEAGRRRSSEDDLLLRLNHAQDLGVGRGLNPAPDERGPATWRSEEHTSELQSQSNLVCRLLLEKKNTSPSKS